MAAVELLIGHRFWLGRADFVEQFVEVDPDPAGRVLAFVDWAGAVKALGAGRLVCSGSQGQVLRLAASLAEGIPLDLGAAVSGLDEISIELVVAAVLAGNGRRRTPVVGSAQR